MVYGMAFLENMILYESERAAWYEKENVGSYSVSSSPHLKHVYTDYP